MYKNLALLLNLFLSIFIFYVIIHWIVFLILFSDGLLLMHRDEIEFCILILCFANLLSLFICFNMFSWITMSFLHIWSCHLLIKIFLHFPFKSEFFLIIIFSCLITCARTFSTLLNRNAKGWQPPLISDVRKKALIFHL